MNKLYLGDCLYVLRESVKDESIDLIYIDPPFNSKRDYNIFFDDKEIQTQRIAFEDTWTLKNIQDSLIELDTLRTEKLYKLVMTYSEVAMDAFPYITMMAIRLIELHRVLKPTGSFYLHCDPNMSHYLKTVCDVIFDKSNFRNEIIWCYTSPGHSKKDFQRKHDIILRYTKTSNFTFNQQYIPYKSGIHVKKEGEVYAYKGTIKESKAIEYEERGKPVEDWWTDIYPLDRVRSESLGYPTQKPKKLLKRIIEASSNEGDIVLDAFCGCGTTLDVVEGLNRKWIGIDISPVATALIKRRLKDTYKSILSKFEVSGIPLDEISAIKLWQENPYAFQDWWLTEFEVFSTTFGKKGADKGLDGIGLYLIDNKGNKIKSAFQIKGGKNIHSKDIDALLGAMEKHNCKIGIFLTISKPTKPMLETVAKIGFVEIPGFKYPKLQILTLEEYFAGKRPKLPSLNITFKSAKNIKKLSKQLGFM